MDNFNFNTDNPWLFLKAIQMSYPDIIKNISFDSEINDWFITVKNQNLYWAHGRLLPKKDIKNWMKWSPIISYFYSDEVPNPKDYPDELVTSLKPQNLIKHRKASPPPNYTFTMLLFNGKNRSQIIKQLRRTRFLGYDVWVHNRVAEPLMRVQKKIYEAQKYDASVKNFLKNLNECWSFNWRIIADSGKISNHSWGSAIDILPKNYRKKKIYWFWEAAYNDYWMKIMPYQRWIPPKVIIDAFESEGFIWGGKWTLWDNMHFEYRPELLYIQKFVLSSQFNEFIAQTTDGLDKKDTNEIIKPEKKISEKLSIIFQIADIVKFTSSFSKRLSLFYGLSEDIDLLTEPKYLEEMIE